MPDKFAATWVSHSSLGDFLACPRSYYLKNIYRNPETGHKVQLMSPALALGQIVHRVLESLSIIPTEKRMAQPILEQYEQEWKSIRGKAGGFQSDSQEEMFRERGADMIRRVLKNPGPIKQKAVKIAADLPQYWLSEEDEIILCGKIDWLEYFADQDAVSVLDFKTGKNKEKPDSLQLPIYLLLATNTQKRPVVGTSYWYLATSDAPEKQELPSLDDAYERVLGEAKKLKLARQLGRFICPEGKRGCRNCTPFEKIVRGEAEFIGEGEYGHDTFIILRDDADEKQSEIL